MYRVRRVGVLLNRCRCTPGHLRGILGGGDVVKPPLDAPLVLHEAQRVSQEGREDGWDCRGPKPHRMNWYSLPQVVPESRLVPVGGTNGELVVGLSLIHI